MTGTIEARRFEAGKSFRFAGPFKSLPWQATQFSSYTTFPAATFSALPTSTGWLASAGRVRTEATAKRWRRKTQAGQRS